MNADPWRTAGERIQTLLDALSAGGPTARERAEQLVREVVDLYGAGLERIVALTDDAALAGYAQDDLVASLLLVHGLHPHDVRRRVADALDSVRPYLGSHGGDVQLLEVVPGPDGDMTARLRFDGNCRGCPSSAATLELAVEDAVRAAAPEVSVVEVVAEPSSESATEPVIPAESLLTHLHSAAPTEWRPVPELELLGLGEVGGFEVAGTVVLACRVGEGLFAYRDQCPDCGESMAGAVFDHTDHPVLHCPRCAARYDVVHAGAGLDGTNARLEPVPLLVRDGVPSLAVRAEPTGLPV